MEGKKFYEFIKQCGMRSDSYDGEEDDLGEQSNKTATVKTSIDKTKVHIDLVKSF